MTDRGEGPKMSEQEMVEQINKIPDAPEWLRGPVAEPARPEITPQTVDMSDWPEWLREENPSPQVIESRFSEILNEARHHRQEAAKLKQQNTEQADGVSSVQDSREKVVTLAQRAEKLLPHLRITFAQQYLDAASSGTKEDIQTPKRKEEKIRQYMLEMIANLHRLNHLSDEELQSQGREVLLQLEKQITILEASHAANLEAKGSRVTTEKNTPDTGLNTIQRLMQKLGSSGRKQS